MLENTHHLVRKVGKKLGLSDQAITDLLKADAEHEFEIKLANGKKHKAYRVQHNNQLGPYKGGIRFHPDLNLDEVRALAILMSLKTAAIGLPYGGAKGGVIVNAKELSKEELEDLSRQYAAHLAPNIGPDKDIPAPDVSTNSEIIDWMVDEYEKQTGDTSKAAFTGKSHSKGGSHGREEATGRGGVIVLDEVLKKLGKNEPLTLAIQGLGNVGSYFGEIVEQEKPDWKLVASTDSSGGIFDEKGLSAQALDDFKDKGGKLIDFKAGKPITNDEFIAQPVNVLVLAALGDSVNQKNMKRVKAEIILELANGPVSEKAHDYLSQNGVIIIPDIIANAGGVVVSYLEWLQNKRSEHWPKNEVNHQLGHYMKRAANTVFELSKRLNTNLKEAAVALAIQRILLSNRGETK